MDVTPGFYGHLITLLSGLANGKLAVCLEGGYFIPSLAEGAAMTLRSLLGDPVAILPPMLPPHKVVIDTINDLKCFLLPYWKCFQHVRFTAAASDEEERHELTNIYKGTIETPPYPTRNCYPAHAEGAVERNTAIIKALQQGKFYLFIYLIAETGQTQKMCHVTIKDCIINLT